MSQKRFKSITESEFKKLQEKRQSGFTKKSTKWGVKLFQGMFKDFKIGLKIIIQLDKIKDIKFNSSLTKDIPRSGFAPESLM